MINTVDRDSLWRMTRERAQIVEVLPRPEYDWAHLPGSVHLPLQDLTQDQATAVLARDRPVIVYCGNTECDLSPRAAARLHRLGFAHVYDYVGGKMDWLSYGLPYEGEASLVGPLARRDVPTCHVDDRLAGVRRAGLGGADLVVVVDDDQIVQGVLDHHALAHGREDLTAEQAMTVGPTTVRPSEEVDALVERMRRAGVDTILVTTSDGRLYGAFDHAAADSAPAAGR